MIAILRVVSLNCNGLGDKLKRKKLFRHLTRRNADVILLQETHTTDDTSKAFKSEWKRLRRGHFSVWNSGTSRSCGVAVLLRNKTTTKVIDSSHDAEGRVLTLQVLINDDVFQFVSVYAPNAPGSRPLFFENLDEHLFPDGDTLVGGDFNMVEDIQLDRSGGTPNSAHEKGKVELNQVKLDNDLVDIWRKNSPTAREYTWSSGNRLIHSRIDLHV